MFILSERAYATSYILVINSNLGCISHRFRDMASLPLKTHIFPTTPSIQRRICTRSLKFCILDAASFASAAFISLLSLRRPIVACEAALR